MLKNITCSVFTFENLINGNYLYIDKTEHIWNLVKDANGIFFFHRPRRFGKSLTISTLKAVFQGKKELFKNTAIYDKDYDWEKYPVIHLDMGNIKCNNAEALENDLVLKLKEVAETYQIELNYPNAQSMFRELILELSKNGEKVVIIVDEYDKPILSNILEPEAESILNVLKGFYGVIKTCEPYERFVFITGVSKFSHVSIFSELNNLRDISMNREYAEMLGYTQEEFEENFAPYIKNIADEKGVEISKLLEKMKTHYNGYKFEEKSKTVYNPSSIAQFFLNAGKFKNYWFSTGTPTFLLKAMKTKNFDIEKVLTEPVSDIAFSAYEINDINPLSLLLQTGYLTMKSAIERFGEYLYYLDFPNFEVRSSFNAYLLNSYTTITADEVKSKSIELAQALADANVDGFMDIVKRFCAGIPYDIHLGNEKYYQTVFYVLFDLLGVSVDAEARTNDGRVDAVCAYQNNVFIFEFKLNKSAEIALNQIKDKEYYKKYENPNKNIYLVSVNFDKDKGQVEEYLFEKLV